MPVSSGKQTLRTKRLTPHKYLIYRKLIVSEFSQVIGGWSEVILYQPRELLPEAWMEDDWQVGLASKWAELSFVCVNELTVSAQEVFNVGLCFSSF